MVRTPYTSPMVVQGTTQEDEPETYYQSGGTVTKANQEYTATETDESAVNVTDNGVFTLTNSTITTSGDTSSQDNSSFYGLNAAVLAEAGANIFLSDSTINYQWNRRQRRICNRDRIVYHTI